MPHVSWSVAKLTFILPILLAMWTVGSVWLTDRLGNCFYDAGWSRLVFKGCLVFVLLPMPLMDEIISRPQFEAKCPGPLASGPAAGPAPAGQLARLLGSDAPLSYAGLCPGRDHTL